MKTYTLMRAVRCLKTREVFEPGAEYTPPSEAEEQKLLAAGYFDVPLKTGAAVVRENLDDKTGQVEAAKTAGAAQLEADVAEFAEIKTKADLVEFVETLEIPVNVELNKDELFAAVAKYFEEATASLAD